MHPLKIGLAAAALLAAPALAQETATANFINSAGEPVGEATLTDTLGGVLIAVSLTSMPTAQWISFHVHEAGECLPENAFESAGGHFNPSGVAHGYFAEGGPHAGDMPNLHTDAEGAVQAQVFNPLVRLAEGEASIRGLALLIHDAADDYTSQPAGNAGDRIACAVIE